MALALETRAFSRDGVPLKALVSEGDPARVPAVFLPGFLGPAEAYRTELEHLFPRPGAALALRGSPGAGAPASGWRAEAFYQDLAFLVERLGYPRFFLSAYSANVPFALRYAAEHPARVAGLVLIDYGPRVPPARPAWKKRLQGRLPEKALKALVREFDGLDATPCLARVKAPVSLLRGEPERGSLLSAADARLYRERLSDLREHVFPGAGHEVWQPDPGAYLGALRSFFDALDPIPR